MQYGYGNQRHKSGFVLFSFPFLIFLISSGFAFVYFDEEADADDAIRGLDGTPFGYGRRKLSVEWARVIF